MHADSDSTDYFNKPKISVRHMCTLPKPALRLALNNSPALLLMWLNDHEHIPLMTQL